MKLLEYVEHQEQVFRWRSEGKQSENRIFSKILRSIRNSKLKLYLIHWTILAVASDCYRETG